MGHNNKIVWITGTSSGFGKLIVKLLSKSN